MKTSLGIALLFSLLTNQAQAVIIGMPWKDTLRVTSVGNLEEPKLEIEYDGLDCPYQMSLFIPDMFAFRKDGELVPTYILEHAHLEGTSPRTKAIMAFTFFPLEKDKCRDAKGIPQAAHHKFVLNLWTQFFVGDLAGAAKNDFIKGDFTLDICYQFPLPNGHDSTIGCKDISYTDLKSRKELNLPQ